MKKVIILSCLALFLAISAPAYAHPGNTDSNGCHTCRTNCTERWGIPYGFYHRHNPVRPCFEPTPAPPPQTATFKPLSTATSTPKPFPTSRPTSLPTATPMFVSPTTEPTPTTIPTITPTSIPTPTKTIKVTPSLQPDVKGTTTQTDLRWHTHWWNFSPLTTLFAAMFGWK